MLVVAIIDRTLPLLLEDDEGGAKLIDACFLIEIKVFNFKLIDIWINLKFFEDLI